MISFWPLMILVITNGFRAMRGRKVPRSAFDDFPILLAHAESRLDFALWREACRRLGWNPRDVQFTLTEASDDWEETTRRFQSCQRASRNLETCARHYVEELRQRYSISQRDLSAHGSTDARLCRTAHHELVDVSAVVSAASRPSTCRAEAARRRKDERGHAHARGPPFNLKIRKSAPTHLARPTREIAPACPIPA